MKQTTAKQPSAPRAGVSLAIFTLLLSCSPARAGLTVYHSRVDFEAAATEPLFIEDFETYPHDVVLAPVAVPLFGGAVSLSAASGNLLPISIDAPPYLFGNGLYGTSGVDAPGFGEKFVTANIMDGPDGGLLRIDLAPISGSSHRLGFDYSGAGGDLSQPFPGLVPGSAHFLSCRVTTLDGTVTREDWPINPEDGWQVDDGFIGFYDPVSPIVSIELLNLSDLAAPDDPVGYRLKTQAYAIDHITTSLPDGDDDGMPDFFELAHGLNPALDDSAADADLDGLTNLEEFVGHTNPTSTDTDHDGLGDLAEVTAGFDPTDRTDPSFLDFGIDFGPQTKGFVDPVNGDFGPGDDVPYPDYDAADQVAEQFVTKFYPAFGGRVSVTPSYPDTTVAGAQRMIARSLNPADVLFDAIGVPWSWFLIVSTPAEQTLESPQESLLGDFLGVDTQPASGGNGDYDGITGTPTRLLLTLGGLPAGSYRWTSFHHDLDFLRTEFIVEVSTDGGTTFLETGRYRMTHGKTFPDDDFLFSDIRHGPLPEALPSTVDTVIAADGINDVMLRFTPLSANREDERVFGINGFQLLQITATPVVAPLAITAFIRDPAAGTATVAWQSTAGKSYTVETSPDLTPASWQTLASGMPANPGANETRHLQVFPGGVMSPTWIVRVREEP